MSTSDLFWERGFLMPRWTEPGYIAYQRRTGADTILEPPAPAQFAGLQEFIMVCGMGSQVLWIRWWARDVCEARDTFREWLAKPWQVLTTDFAGNGLVNGLDFKPSKIDWFTVTD
ncbi:hypothetical protein [Actinophytocola sp.]|uniref:hypothetical protein n=1 Tax=Actinophytocola sp. TaxID=1872138 RepID=UPI002F935C86